MPTVYTYYLYLPVCAYYLYMPTIYASYLCYYLYLPVCNLGERSARLKAPPNSIDRINSNRSLRPFAGCTFKRWLSGSGDGRLAPATVVWFWRRSTVVWFWQRSSAGCRPGASLGREDVRKGKK